MSSLAKHIEAASSRYSTTFISGDLPAPPAKHFLVVTCMDARIDPAQAFGIKLGDAHIVRNAGGSAQEALRSIIVSQQFLGTREIVLVKHTGCGMLGLKNETVYSAVEGSLGAAAASALRVRIPDFLPFPALEKAIHEDVAFLRATGLIPADVPITGWIYHVENGTMDRIV